MTTTMLKKQTTDAYTRMVIDAIQSKIGGRTLTCPVSQDSHREVQEYQGMLPAMDRFNDVQPLTEMNRSFPLAVPVCKTCGYSMMFNLFALGVGEDLGLTNVRENEHSNSETTALNDSGAYVIVLPVQ